VDKIGCVLSQALRCFESYERGSRGESLSGDMSVKDRTLPDHCRNRVLTRRIVSQMLVSLQGKQKVCRKVIVRILTVDK